MRTLNRSAASLALELQQRQAEAVAMVNQAHGKTRMRHITVIEGQDMLYMDKHAEAVRYLAEIDPQPDLSTYDLLPAEIGITGQTAYEVAQVIVNTAALWRQLAGALETVRLGTIQTIEQATTLSDIDTALADFATSMEALQ